MQNITFNPHEWAQAAPGKSLACGKVVHVRLSAPSAVEVDIGDGYRVVGHGTEFKITLPASGRIRASAATLCLHVPPDRPQGVGSDGAPFTNFDKRPGESAIETMVRRTLREGQVKDALARAARRQHDLALNDKRVAKGLQESNPLREGEEQADATSSSETKPVEGETTEPVSVPQE